MKLNHVLCAVLITTPLITVSPEIAASDKASEVINAGKFYSDFRLRYENVSQDNPLDDATALTLRTRLGFTSGSIDGFSGTVEFEDSRIVLGQGDFAVPPSGFNTGEYSVIADPETTEIDQFFIQYKADSVTTKVGRQVLTMNNHRFIGHVGWRQDRQTFDGITASFNATKDLAIDVAYLTQRNRIFGEDADLDSEDLLLNIKYDSAIGPITFYSFNLEVDDVSGSDNDTLGIFVDGKSNSFSYYAEYAIQDANGNDADYVHLVAGTKLNGFALKAGYEILGSDNGNYGFSTPLATLHKFNGWADLFLSTPASGLKDFYISAATKLGDGNFLAAYHTYEADSGGADYGTELNLQYVMKFAKHYNAGIKAAFYSSDGFAVDTDKIWLWVGASF